MIYLSTSTMKREPLVHNYLDGFHPTFVLRFTQFYSLPKHRA